MFFIKIQNRIFIRSLVLNASCKIRSMFPKANLTDHLMQKILSRNTNFTSKHSNQSTFQILSNLSNHYYIISQAPKIGENSTSTIFNHKFFRRIKYSLSKTSWELESLFNIWSSPIAFKLTYYGQKTNQEMMDSKIFHCRKHKANPNNANLKMIAPLLKRRYKTTVMTIRPNWSIEPLVGFNKHQHSSSLN